MKSGYKQGMMEAKKGSGSKAHEKKETKRFERQETMGKKAAKKR